MTSRSVPNAVGPPAPFVGSYAVVRPLLSPMIIQCPECPPQLVESLGSLRSLAPINAIHFLNENAIDASRPAFDKSERFPSAHLFSRRWESFQGVADLAVRTDRFVSFDRTRSPGRIATSCPSMEPGWLGTEYSCVYLPTDTSEITDCRQRHRGIGDRQTMHSVEYPTNKRYSCKQRRKS
jgi:hypothetical protein